MAKPPVLFSSGIVTSALRCALAMVIRPKATAGVLSGRNLLIGLIDSSFRCVGSRSQVQPQLPGPRGALSKQKHGDGAQAASLSALPCRTLAVTFCGPATITLVMNGIPLLNQFREQRS